jgi:hypothetical protein
VTAVEEQEEQEGQEGQEGQGEEMVDVIAALELHGLLVPTARYLSCMPLYAEADAVIAPISSGSKGAFLHSLTMPLVLLRPAMAWGGGAQVVYR